MGLFSKHLKEKHLIPNTLVIDYQGGYGLEYIENPSGGKKFYQGKLVHVMTRSSGVLAPLSLPVAINNPPEKLYRALHWRDIVEKLYKKGTSWMEKVKVGLLFGIFGILLFFIYLIINSVGG